MKGFTLLELLVVVLIIGILSSVALPQYQKAVWKSRASALISSVKSVGQAAEVYRLANGAYPHAFADLDVDLGLPVKGGSPSCGNGLASTTDGLRGNDMYEVMVNVRDDAYGLISSTLKQGPYRCGGFVYVIEWGTRRKGEVYCWEWEYEMTPAGKFCQKLFNASYEGTANQYRYYRMP